MYLFFFVHRGAARQRSEVTDDGRRSGQLMRDGWMDERNGRNRGSVLCHPSAGERKTQDRSTGQTPKDKYFGSAASFVHDAGRPACFFTDVFLFFIFVLCFSVVLSHESERCLAGMDGVHWIEFLVEDLKSTVHLPPCMAIRVMILHQRVGEWMREEHGHGLNDKFSKRLVKGCVDWTDEWMMIIMGRLIVF